MMISAGLLFKYDIQQTRTQILLIKQLELDGDNTTTTTDLHPEFALFLLVLSCYTNIID